MNSAALRSAIPRIQQIWKSRAELVAKNLNSASSTESPNKNMNDDSDLALQDLSVIKRAKQNLLMVGEWCFHMASIKDKEDWICFYMMGKLRACLGWPVKKYLGCLIKSIQLVPEDWPTKEQEKILDPKIKLVSVLCRALNQDEIAPSVVKSIIEKIFPNTINSDQLEIIQPDPNLNLSQNYHENINGSTTSEFINNSKEETRNSQNINLLEKTPQNDKINAFGSILAAYKSIKAIDKKKWQHKPLYKIAWIKFNVFGDAEGAKAEMAQLINQKPVGLKSFVSFWKSEFERPGKHFVYVDKYVMFMLRLLKETRDVEGLRAFIKKLKISDDVLLWPDRVGTCAEEYYFEFTLSVPAETTEPLTMTMLLKRASIAKPKVEKKRLDEQKEIILQEESTAELLDHAEHVEI
ncbi:Histone transcription regulator 3, partial [Nowakowskiella sp. JEL0078]